MYENVNKMDIENFIIIALTRKRNSVIFNTIQYNTIQYNTIQYNTIQYNTIQYNTIISMIVFFHKFSQSQLQEYHII